MTINLETNWEGTLSYLPALLTAQAPLASGSSLFSALQLTSFKILPAYPSFLLQQDRLTCCWSYLECSLSSLPS